MKPDKPFNEALADLLAAYCEMPVDEMIEVMELHLEGLRDDVRNIEEDLATDGH